MTRDQRPGEGGPDGEVVVPHPFGSGSPAGPTAERQGQDAEVDLGPTDGQSEDVEPEVVEPAAAPEPHGVAEGTDPASQVEVEASSATAADLTPEQEAAPAARRRTRDPLAALLIGVLTLILGFAFAVQVRSVGDDQQYEGAREEDLVRILDELNAREERLREQLTEQRSDLQQLNSSDSQSAAALEEARQRAEAIGILNGTVAAQGPGLVMTVRDPGDEVRVADVLDAIQELRGAGAETMQIDGVRVGVSTAITGVPGSLMVDGRPITAPYEFVVIGSPQDMETALNIPGGVVPRISGRGGSVEIVQSPQVVVDALRPLDTPQYAQPEGD